MLDDRQLRRMFPSALERIKGLEDKIEEERELHERTKMYLVLYQVLSACAAVYAVTHMASLIIGV